MLQDVTVWHHLAGMGLFCTIGVLAHVCRGIFTPSTDRLPKRSLIHNDDRVSITDRLFGTEYDEAGYYRLVSLRNLRNAVALSALSGFLVMGLSADVAALMARVIDTGVSALSEIASYRFDNVALL